MAAIEERENAKGEKSYRVKVRVKGYASKTTGHASGLIHNHGVHAQDGNDQKIYTGEKPTFGILKNIIK